MFQRRRQFCPDVSPFECSLTVVAQLPRRAAKHEPAVTSFLGNRRQSGGGDCCLYVLGTFLLLSARRGSRRSVLLCVCFYLAITVSSLWHDLHRGSICNSADKGSIRLHHVRNTRSRHRGKHRRQHVCILLPLPMHVIYLQRRCLHALLTDSVVSRLAFNVFPFRTRSI